MTPSLAQIRTLVPTVACSEDEPDEQLPEYPPAPDEPANVFALKAFSAAQGVWAGKAIGVHRREIKKRAATSACLADLRARGLIN